MILRLRAQCRSVLFPRRKSTKSALKGRGCFDSPSPPENPYTHNDILEGGSALAQATLSWPSANSPCLGREPTPRSAALQSLPHHELPSYSAATINKSVCIAVRGPIGEVAGDGSDFVPHIPKGCFYADAQTSQRLKMGIPKGLAPGAVFGDFLQKQKVTRSEAEHPQ